MIERENFQKPLNSNGFLNKGIVVCKFEFSKDKNGRKRKTF